MERYMILILSYILGSIPFSLIVAKAQGINLRTAGSGNIGATNVLRNCKKKLAALALLLDSLKGFIAVYVVQQFLSNHFLFNNVAVILAVLGHMFPIWLKFKGGKGVATTLGILFAFNIQVALMFIFTWVTIFSIFRYSSLASLGSVMISTVTAFFLCRDLFLTLLIITTLIFLKHYQNIINLCQGSEYKFL